ncbi:hypothetical protein ONZ45_g16962 [Pleurotus djamor]|nr:hypothetical protein ONZ45_g16962 [Pleurotus djamor]
MSLTAGDPSDRKGQRFALSADSGRYILLVRHQGGYRITYTPNHGEEASLEDLIGEMSLERDNSIVVVESSDEEDSSILPDPQTTPSSSHNMANITPRSTARSSRGYHTSPESIAFTNRSGRLPTAHISEPETSESSTNTSVAFPLHPTAPPYSGRGPINPAHYAVPRHFSRRYPKPWSSPSKNERWYVIKAGFEVGVFWDTWDKVQPLVCLEGKVNGYDGTIYNKRASFKEAIELWGRGENHRISYPFPLS